MGWKRWSLVAIVIGGGILLQIPGHDVMDMGQETLDQVDLPAGMADPRPPFETVAIDVTGMT